MRKQEKCLYKIAQEQDIRMRGHKTKCDSCDGYDVRCRQYRNLFDLLFEQGLTFRVISDPMEAIGDNFPVIGMKGGNE